MITWMKNVNSFQKRFNLGVLLSICLFFCQFQPGVTYKSVAYKKGVYLFSALHFFLLRFSQFLFLNALCSWICVMSRHTLFSDRKELLSLFL